MRLRDRLAGILSQPRERSVIARLAGPPDGMARLLLDDAVGATVALDQAGRVVRANDALAELMQEAAPPRRGTAFGALFDEQARGHAWDEVAQVLRGPVSRQGRHFATMLASPLGGLDVLASAAAIVEADRRVTGALLRFTDISAQRHLEAQLAHNESLRALGLLAGGIAHDFNNLLAAILGAADDLIERRTSDPQDDAAEDIRQIRASALRGAGLVQQLLAFGRQQTLQSRPLSVNEVIADLSTLLRRLLGARIRIELALEQPGCQIRASRTQLEQVLINLAVNARDAMPTGGTLTLRSGQSTLFQPMAVGHETIPPGRYATIEVHDTGTGIPADILPRIFDPFFTTKREKGGSGLGLATVHGIVRQSEGFLTVESTPGQGTRMKIFLPRRDEAASLTIPPAPCMSGLANPAAAARVPASREVLLVDDEEALRHLAARALTRAGWTVLEAESGEAALALLQARPIEAPPLAGLVTDMVMPGLDGLALARQVRRWARREDLPVVLMSGFADSPLREGADSAATNFLPKPFPLADLVAALAETMGNPHNSAQFPTPTAA